MHPAVITGLAIVAVQVLFIGGWIAAIEVGRRWQERRDFNGCVHDALHLLWAEREAEYLTWLEDHWHDEEVER